MNYEKKLKYAADAIEVTNIIKNFDFEAFEKWVEGVVLQIGSQNVMQYLEEKKRWNVNAILISDKRLKADFSAQANNIIKHIPAFNAEDCIVWFSNALQMTKGDILNYLENVSRTNNEIRN